MGKGDSPVTSIALHPAGFHTTNRPFCLLPRYSPAFRFVIRTLSLFFSLVLVPVLCAQTAPTYSPVVGFEKITISGTGGSGPAKLSFGAMPLVPILQAAGSMSSASGTTLADSTATWSNDQFNGSNGRHYLEIVSVHGSTTASGVGTTYDIADTTAPGTLTLSRSLDSGVTAPLGYLIRKHWTLAAVFGVTNDSGLQGGTATTADQVHVWNKTGYDIYYYQTAGIGGTGWRKTGDQTTDASGTVIDPSNCLISKRGQSASTTVTVLGAVKTGATRYDITPGYNLVPNPNALAMTLASCGLYTGDAGTGVAGGTAASADQVLLWNGSGYDTYYYQTSGIGGTGWRKTGDQTTDASTATIAVGTSFIVRRLHGGGFAWMIPQHPASF